MPYARPPATSSGTTPTTTDLRGRSPRMVGLRGRWSSRRGVNRGHLIAAPRAAPRAGHGIFRFDGPADPAFEETEARRLEEIGRSIPAGGVFAGHSWRARHRIDGYCSRARSCSNPERRHAKIRTRGHSVRLAGTRSPYLSGYWPTWHGRLVLRCKHLLTPARRAFKLLMKGRTGRLHAPPVSPRLAAQRVHHPPRIVAEGLLDRCTSRLHHRSHERARDTSIAGRVFGRGRIRGGFSSSPEGRATARPVGKAWCSIGDRGQAHASRAPCLSTRSGQTRRRWLLHPLGVMSCPRMSYRPGTSCRNGVVPSVARSLRQPARRVPPRPECRAYGDVVARKKKTCGFLRATLPGPRLRAAYGRGCVARPKVGQQLAVAT